MLQLQAAPWVARASGRARCARFSIRKVWDKLHTVVIQRATGQAAAVQGCAGRFCDVYWSSNCGQLGMAAPEQCLQQRGMRATMLPAWRGLRAASTAASSRCSNTLLSSHSSYGSSTGVTAGRRCTPSTISPLARGTVATHASPPPSASFLPLRGASLPFLAPRPPLALSHGSVVGLPAPLPPPSRVVPLLPARWHSNVWAAGAIGNGISGSGSRSIGSSSDGGTGATSSSSRSSSGGSGKRAVATAAGRKAAAATEAAGNGAAASGETAAPAAEPSEPAGKRRGRKKQAVQEGVQVSSGRVTSEGAQVDAGVSIRFGI